MEGFVLLCSDVLVPMSLLVVIYFKFKIYINHFNSCTVLQMLVFNSCTVIQKSTLFNLCLMLSTKSSIYWMDDLSHCITLHNLWKPRACTPSDTVVILYELCSKWLWSTYSHMDSCSSYSLYYTLPQSKYINDFFTFYFVQSIF